MQDLEQENGAHGFEMAHAVEFAEVVCEELELHRLPFR
jgi:hypothetical protein